MNQEQTERLTAENERTSLFGCVLAMRVLQSDLYHQLDDDERSECDELVERWSSHLRSQGFSGAPK